MMKSTYKKTLLLITYFSPYRAEPIDEAIVFHHMSTSTSVSTSECLSAAYLWWDFSVKGALVKSLFTASLTQLNAESQSEQFNL